MSVGRTTPAAGSTRARRSGAIASASPPMPARSSACDSSDGTKLWSTYVKRNTFQYESFYASPSTDGQRLYTVSRAGKVVALNAGPARVLWTRSVGSTGYSTPAISDGKVFAGGFDGRLRAYRGGDGRPRLGDLRRRPDPRSRRRRRQSRLLLDARDEDVRRPGLGRQGRLEDRARQVLAGDRDRPRYYFSLNGSLIAFAQDSVAEASERHAGVGR